MTLKYIERRNFRVTLPTGEVVDIALPMSESFGDLLRKLGLDNNYRVLWQSNELPLDKPISSIKVGKELEVSKVEKTILSASENKKLKKEAEWLDGIHRR